MLSQLLISISAHKCVIKGHMLAIYSSHRFLSHLQSLILICSSVDVVIFGYDLRFVCHQHLWDPDLHPSWWAYYSLTVMGSIHKGGVWPMFHLHNSAAERLKPSHFQLHKLSSQSDSYFCVFLYDPAKTADTCDGSEMTHDCRSVWFKNSKVL